MRRSFDWKTLLTEASIISGLVLYSYVVYIAGEAGRLNAYGIRNASSYVTLDVQNIIVAFLNSLFYFTIFMIITISVIKVTLLSKRKLTRNQREIRTKLGGYLLLSVIFLVLIPNMLSGYSNFWIYTIYTIVLIVNTIIFFVKVPFLGRSVFDASGDVTNNYVSGKINKNLNRYKKYILAAFLTLTYVPFINYALNNYSPKTYSPQYVLINRKDSEYLMVRQYSDKVILIKKADKILMPEYKILNIKNIDEMKFRLEYEKYDFSSLSRDRPMLDLIEKTVLDKLNQLIQFGA